MLTMTHEISFGKPQGADMDPLLVEDVGVTKCESILNFWMVLTVMLSLDRNKHRPCQIKGSSSVKTQVDSNVF